MTRSGRARSNWARRRRLLVAMVPPCGMSANPPPFVTSASRASSRALTAAITMPSGNWVGRSFSEWTARSMRDGQHRLIELAGEERRIGQLADGRLGVDVTGGADLDDLGVAPPARERLAHPVGLPERERARPGADAQHAHSASAGIASPWAPKRWRSVSAAASSDSPRSVALRSTVMGRAMSLATIRSAARSRSAPLFAPT